MHQSIKTFLGTVAVASAGAFFSLPAYAERGDYAPQIAPAKNFSQRSRAEVIAELEAARQAGLLIYNERDMDRLLFANFRSTLARAQVAAEGVEAARLRNLRGRTVDAGDDLFTQDELRLIASAGRRAHESPMAHR